MRLATFNLENLGEKRATGPSLDERITILRPQLHRLAADVLCLQEVNGQTIPGRRERDLTALEELIKDTVYEGFHRYSTKSTDGKGVADVHNLVILSRHAFAATAQIRNDFVSAPLYKQSTADPSMTAPAPIGFDRPILFTEINLPDGRALHVINVHLRAPLAAPVAGQKESPFVWRSAEGWAEGYFIAAVKRLGQALEVRLKVDRIFDETDNALIAVCGDFNAEDHEAPIDIISAAQEDTGSGHLSARMLVQTSRSIARDRRFSVLHHGRPQMVDHIFASRALFGAFKQFDVHNESLEDEAVAYAKVDRSPNSYHAPVVATFDL